MNHLFQDEDFPENKDAEYFQEERIGPEDLPRLEMILDWICQKIERLFNIENLIDFYTIDGKGVYVKYKKDIHARNCHVDTLYTEYLIPFEIFLAKNEVFYAWEQKELKKREETERIEQFQKEEEEKKYKKQQRFTKYMELKKEFEG